MNSVGKIVTIKASRLGVGKSFIRIKTVFDAINPRHRNHGVTVKSKRIDTKDYVSNSKNTMYSLVAIPDGSANVCGEILNELSLWVRTKEAGSCAFEQSTASLIQAPILSIPFSKVSVK